jgi:serine/threonine protein kinase
LLDDENKSDEIDKIFLIMANYDITKMRFYDYFLVNNNTYNDMDNINNINNILLKLKELHTLNFIHGDFHTSNILIDNKSNVSFIDPEFSLLLTENNIKIIEDEYPLINLYLKLPIGYQLTNDFLKIFDIYLLVINIYRYRSDKLSFLENIYNYIITNNVLNNYLLNFYVIYYQLFYYIKTYGNITKILKKINSIASFKIIKKILLKKFENLETIKYETDQSLNNIYRIFNELDDINKSLEEP